MCIRIVVVACVDVVLPFASVGGLRSGAVSLSLVMLTHLQKCDYPATQVCVCLPMCGPKRDCLESPSCQGQ